MLRQFREFPQCPIAFFHPEKKKKFKLNQIFRETNTKAFVSISLKMSFLKRLIQININLKTYLHTKFHWADSVH